MADNNRLWRLPYTKEQLTAAAANQVPIVGENGNWWRWDIAASQWQDSGVTVATGLADSSVTWPKLSPEARHSNPNLLDNWYFVGGGSQQGGGQFPINQRGQTEYTGVGYTIDRWKLLNTGALELAADGIVLKTTTANAVLGQPVSGASDLVGKQVTLSFLADPIQNPGGFQICFFNSTNYNTGLLPTAVNDSGTGPKLYTVTFVPQAGFYGISFYVYRNAAQSSEIKLYAAKLELGPYQTLAHQDADGNWVLNDAPPKYGDELAKCQRYQTDLNIFHSGYARFGLGYAYAETLAYVQIPLPTTIRAFPTVEMYGNIGLVDLAAHTVLIPAISIVSDEIAANIANVRVTVAGGLTPGKIYALQMMGDASARLIFNSNL